MSTCVKFDPNSEDLHTNIKDSTKKPNNFIQFKNI